MALCRGVVETFPLSRATYPKCACYRPTLGAGQNFRRFPPKSRTLTFLTVLDICVYSSISQVRWTCSFSLRDNYRFSSSVPPPLSLSLVLLFSSILRRECSSLFLFSPVQIVQTLTARLFPRVNVASRLFHCTLVKIIFALCQTQKSHGKLDASRLASSCGRCPPKGATFSRFTRLSIDVFTNLSLCLHQSVLVCRGNENLPN